MDLLKRINRILRRDGLFGAGKLVLRNAAMILGGERRRQLKAEQQFDKLFGADTAGLVRLDGLRIASENRARGNRYQGINPDHFRVYISELGIPYEQFTFVDIGSGKGRALLLAAQYPFKRVVGIEFAPELHAIAAANIESGRSSDRKCDDVQSICADATQYQIPEDPLVLFFYNPFDQTIMRTVLKKVLASIARQPRPVYLVINGTELQEVASSMGFQTAAGPETEKCGARVFNMKS